MNGPDLQRWDYRPAADLDLGFTERNRSLSCERGLFRRWVHAAVRAVIRSYLRHVHQLSVSGVRNFPEDGPFVIVANHASHLDALAIGAAVPRRRAGDVILLAAGDTFFSSPGRAALAAICLNARPVWRGRCGRKAIGTLRAGLQGCEEAGGSGPIYVIFPEGTRSRTGEMGRFKEGVGALVAGTGVPVVPVCVGGAFAAWPASSRRPARGPVTMSVGPAVRFGGVGNQRAGWRVVAADLEDRVRFLHKYGALRGGPGTTEATAGVTMHTV